MVLLGVQQRVFPGVHVEVFVPGIASAQTSLLVKAQSSYNIGILAIINPYCCSSIIPSIAVIRLHSAVKRSTNVLGIRKSSIAEAVQYSTGVLDTDSEEGFQNERRPSWCVKLLKTQLATNGRNLAHASPLLVEPITCAQCAGH